MKEGNLFSVKVIFPPEFFSALSFKNQVSFRPSNLSRLKKEKSPRLAPSLLKQATFNRLTFSLGMTYYDDRFHVVIYTYAIRAFL